MGIADMSLDSLARADWLDVYHALRADITQGVRQPGTDLPTISSLARETGLTSYGARRVLERLCEEGRAQSWQGRGYRVSMPHIHFKVSQKQPVFGDHIRAQGFTTTSELTSSKTVGAPAEVARLMRPKSGTRLRLTEMLRRVNGRPVALSLDYFRRDRLDGIHKSLARTGSVSASLSEHGITSYRRDATLLTCRAPTAHEAALLEIPRSQAVYATLGANLAPDGDVVQVSKAIWRADCVSYEF